MKELEEAAAEKYDSYSEYIKDIGTVINRIKSDDGGFYRMEKTFQRTNNDPMQFQYNGLSHFSSCEKTFTKNFLGKMGVPK